MAARALRGVGLGIILVSSLAMAGAPVPPGTAPGYANVTSPRLKAMLERKDFVFVNVHIPYDGELPQTDAFIPFNRIEQETSKLPAAKDAKIVLYCMSDRMSTIAAEKLVRLGYTNVRNLTGGMVGWREHGYPLLDTR